jgi:ubiquinone/menaquinone biosynthesis C-methylase UbiE
MRMNPRLYDLLMGSMDRARLSALRRQLAMQAHGRVLEVGAGTGLNYRHYSHDASVVAVDLDPRMLLHSRSRGEQAAARISLVVADAEALPFRDEVFDHGVVGLALCTIPDPAKAVRELLRAMKKGGQLHVLEHVRVQSGAIARLQDLITPAWKHLAGGCHLNRKSEETIAANGFRIETLDRFAGGLIVALTARPTAAGAS